MEMARNVEENNNDVQVDALPMNGGDGIHSYSLNSSYQRVVIEAAKQVIIEAVEAKLEVTSAAVKCFRIADFGCSTGPNTFLAVQNIVEAVQNRFLQAPPEFQVFFNDHIENDFNILFRTMPPNRQYSAAGVPGSFYGRLFPTGSLHLVHCSYALHWLSRVPKEITNRASPAWNRGSIHYTGANEHVLQAYFTQFHADMHCFLNARAKELVPGGLMLLQLPGLPTGEVLFTRTGAGLLHALLGDTLMDMANLGVICEEKVDSFNLPQYHPSPQELEMVIEMNNSFTIERIGAFDHPFRNIPFDVKMTCAQVRSIMEGMLTQHFGHEFMDDLFHHYHNKLAQNYLIFDKEIRRDVDFFLVLKRKNN